MHTEQVLWIAATAVFGGILILRAGGSLLRNFDWTVGRPRGANDGLGGADDASSLLSDAHPSLPPPSP